MRDIPRAASAQFGAFTWDQASAEGWTPDARKHATRSGRIVALRRGVYVLAELMDGDRPADRRRRLATLSAAAVMGQPGAAASHSSSAVLSGLSLLDTPSRPCLTIRPGAHTAATGLHIHRARLEPGRDVVRSGAIARTASARTALDIARELGVDDGVVVADAALHKRKTDIAALERAAAQCRGWPGARQAAEVVQLCDGRSESALETISRLRIRGAGLPRPRLQARIMIDGVVIARTDYLWEEFGVVGEADGLDKYDLSTPFALREEKIRQERLERAGLVVVRWGWADVDTPRACATLAQRLRWAFGRAAQLTDRRARWRVV